MTNLLTIIAILLVSCVFSQASNYKFKDDCSQEISYHSKVECYGDDETGFYHKGNAKYVLGDYSGAILDFNKAIDLAPKYISPLKKEVFQNTI